MAHLSVDVDSPHHDEDTGMKRANHRQKLSNDDSGFQ